MADDWPSTTNGGFLTRMRRAVFGLSAEEISQRHIRMAEITSRIKAASAREDALFHVWWEENKHRFPKRWYWNTEAKTDGSMMPEMQTEHFREFDAFVKEHEHV